MKSLDKKKVKYCDNCEPRIGGVIYVDDVKKPICSKCGRKVLNFDSKIRVKQKPKELECWEKELINSGKHLADILEQYNGNRQCKLCGAEPEKQSEWVIFLVKKLLTQQRTELNREWNSKLLLSQREMINSFKNKVIEELLKDVKKHQDTADSIEMLEFWKQVSYWLKLKQIEI